MAGMKQVLREIDAITRAGPRHTHQNNAPLSYFFCEAWFEALARQCAADSNGPEGGLDGLLVRYRANARACVYLVALGIALLCWAPSVMALAGIVAIIVFGRELPWIVRVIMVIRRAKEIADTEVTP